MIAFLIVTFLLGLMAGMALSFAIVSWAEEDIEP